MTVAKIVRLIVRKTNPHTWPLSVSLTF